MTDKKERKNQELFIKALDLEIATKEQIINSSNSQKTDKFKQKVYAMFDDLFDLLKELEKIEMAILLIQQIVELLDNFLGS